MQYRFLSSDVQGLFEEKLKGFVLDSSIRGRGKTSLSSANTNKKSTTHSRRNSLNAALQKSPVIMKLISRVNSTKELNNLFHYLNKNGDVDLENQDNEVFNGQKIHDLYSEWKSNIDLSEEIKKNFNQLDERHYIPYKKLSKSFVEEMQKNDFDINKVKDSMHNKKREIQDIVNGIGEGNEYYAHAWGSFVKEIGVTLVSIKNNERKKNKEGGLWKKISQVQKRTQFYKNKNKNIARHGVVVFPVGTNENSMKNIAKQSLHEFLKASPADFMVASHTNEGGENPHVHFVINSLRLDGAKLDFKKEDVMRFREIIAEKSLAHDIHLHSGRSWERGKIKENIPQAVIHKVVKNRVENQSGKDFQQHYKLFKNEVKNERLHFLNVSKSNQKTQFTKHMLKQAGLIQLDVDFFRKQYSENGNDTSLKKAQLLENHMTYIKDAILSKDKGVKHEEEKVQNSTDVSIINK